LYYFVCEFRGSCCRVEEASRVSVGGIEGFERNFVAFLPVADFEFRSAFVKGHGVAKIADCVGRGLAEGQLTWNESDLRVLKLAFSSLSLCSDRECVRNAK
jgi:hypothetical protein